MKRTCRIKQQMSLCIPLLESCKKECSVTLNLDDVIKCSKRFCNKMVPVFPNRFKYMTLVEKQGFTGIEEELANQSISILLTLS